jgi:uncharacterized membrane protein
MRQDKASVSLHKDESGLLDLNRPMRIVGVVIGGIVIVLLLAALTAPFFGAIGDINTNISEAETGDDAGDVILGVFPLVIAVGAVLGFVGLVLAAVAFARR